jgi:flagellar basal body P-ring formation protein FlgA
MKQILIMLAAAMCFVAAVTAQAATLRPDATIDADVVTVGDLFDGAGEAEGGTVGRAPAPGRKAVYDATFLARAARAFGLDWRPASVHDRVVLTRASTLVRADEVQLAIQQALADRVAEGRVEVELDNRLLELHLPAGGTADVVVESVNHDQQQGRFAATIVVSAAGAQERFSVTGRAGSVIEVPVLNRSVKSGEVIGEADIAWVELRQARTNDDVLRDAGALVGMSPRRTLPPNAPVRSRDLREPSLVTRGSLVTIRLESRSMVLTAQGRALEDGADGQVVRVVNTMSNRTIEATVAGPGIVAVARASTLQQF